MGGIKLSKKLRPLWTDDYDYAVITGGRGSGKSFAVGDFLENLSFEPDHIILFTRYTMTSAHLSVIPEFQEKIEIEQHQPYFDIKQTEIINKATDSKILFRGIKTSSGVQTASLKSIQGLTTWVVDEAEELTDVEVFDKIDESVRSKKVKNRVILILNPAMKTHWIYKRFFEEGGVNEGFNGIKNRVLYIHTTYLDNFENLSSKFIKKVERLKETNPDKYKHRILGGWLDRPEGVILSNWELGEFVNQALTGHGLDFGSVDPDAMSKVAIDNKNKLIYIKEEMYNSDQGTDDLIANIKSKVSKNELIVADSTERRLIGDIKNKGFNIKKAYKPDGSIVAGIKKLQDYKLIIDPDSTNLVMELNHYCWHDKKAEVPIDAYNHLIDGIRYIVMDLLSNRKKRIRSRKN